MKAGRVEVKCSGCGITIVYEGDAKPDKLCSVCRDKSVEKKKGKIVSSP